MFGIQMTQNAISLIMKKHTDEESMIDHKISAKHPKVAQYSKLEDDLST